MELVSIPDPQDKWAKTIEVRAAGRSPGLRLDLGVRPLPQRAGTGARDDVRVLDDARRARHRHRRTCASARWSAARRTAIPGLLAKITSNIDVISGGRLDWGVGAGWYEHEYKAYGYGFPAAKDRIRMLRETVEIVKSMWSEPDTTYDGKFFQLDGAQCDPKPLQDPHPPIWIGGGGEQLTLRVVARHADRSNFGGKPHEFQHKCEVLQGHCREVGRDYDEIVKTWSPELFVRDDRARDHRRRQQVVLGRAVRFVARRKSRGHTRAGVREDPGLHGARPRGHRGLAVGLPGHRVRPVVRREGHPRVPLNAPDGHLAGPEIDGRDDG